MTKQEEVWEGMKEILSEDLIVHNITHEIPPPGKDCYEDCGVREIHTGALRPMRSGGKKHKKCMDCWNEYIDGLILRLITKQASQGVVIKVELAKARASEKLKASFTLTEPLIEEGK